MRKTVFFLIVVVSSCIEPYKPDISKYENVFVVDGKLTNLPGPYTVKLSKSFEFDERSGQPVSGAQLKIIDNFGKEVDLKETMAGVYITNDGSFRGIPGNSYKLQIKLDGETYESSYEALKEPIEVDSLYWEYKKLINGVEGIRILLDTHDPQNNTRYYGWDFEETWKFTVPSPYPKRPDWNECFKSAFNNHFNVATTITRKEDDLHARPLQFIDESTNRLYFRYSILVTQYSLTEQTYDYFEDLISINQNQGTLFDPIPQSLVGNIKNLSNKDLPVLGYFMVAGASQKRIFIDRSELPRDFRPISGFEKCDQIWTGTLLKYQDNPRQDKKVDSIMRLGYDIIFELPFVEEGVLILYLAPPPCFNCTLNGTNVVPDFWTDRVTKSGELKQ